MAETNTSTSEHGKKGATFIWGTGRRKTSVARVRIRLGSGKFLIDKREIERVKPRSATQDRRGFCFGTLTVR